MCILFSRSLLSYVTASPLIFTPSPIHLRASPLISTLLPLPLPLCPSLISTPLHVPPSIAPCPGQTSTQPSSPISHTHGLAQSRARPNSYQTLGGYPHPLDTLGKGAWRAPPIASLTWLPLVSQGRRVRSPGRRHPSCSLAPRARGRDLRLRSRRFRWKRRCRP